MSGIKPQLQLANSGFAVSNHRFMNKIASGISTLVEANIPGLRLEYIGKSVTGNSISANLMGEVLVDDIKLADVSDKIRGVMQELKNPSNLLSIIKE